jgi:hypothetical protein
VNGRLLGAAVPPDVDGVQIDDVVSLVGCLDVDPTSRAGGADVVVQAVAVILLSPAAERHIFRPSPRM